MIPLAAASLLKVSDLGKAQLNLALFPLATGFLLGTLAKQSYNQHIDYAIDEFFESKIKPTSSDSSRHLDLSNHCDQLRYLDLVKLGKKISEESRSSNKPFIFFILQNCKLTDSDLKLLGKAGWFSDFPKVNVSNNPQLTHIGLKWIGKGGAEKLETLDLSFTDLTDDDLKEMALSGYFNKLKTLILSNNPRLTGKGLAWMAKGGFEGLKILNLSGNTKVIRENLEEWLQIDGFKNLEALELNRTDIEEKDLEQMIDKAEWFRRLKGLSLDNNCNLAKFPSNILKLTNLGEHTVSAIQFLSGKVIPFKGVGLFFKCCHKLTLTQETYTLIQKRKALGGTSMLTYIIPLVTQ